MQLTWFGDLTCIICQGCHGTQHTPVITYWSLNIHSDFQSCLLKLKKWFISLLAQGVTGRFKCGGEKQDRVNSYAFFNCQGLFAILTLSWKQMVCLWIFKWLIKWDWTNNTVTKSLNGIRLDVNSVKFDAINLNIPMKIALSKSANAALWRKMLESHKCCHCCWHVSPIGIYCRALRNHCSPFLSLYLHRG